jgi:polyhydroxybutyrate depolymerase
MAHRLACEFPQVSAIASVAGGNQFSTTRPCTRAASVLEIHGTADPCWAWDGGPASCADTNPGAKISGPDTLARWAVNNGCDGGVTTSSLPDTISDGTVTRRHEWNCSGAALELYEVVDGGHTWPNGFSYSSGAGATALDWSANTVILDFFDSH